MSNAMPPSLDHVRVKRPVGPAPAPITGGPKVLQPTASQTVVGEAPLGEQVSSTTEPQVAPQTAPSQAARWLIEFELLVTQPLHVGSGEDQLLPAEKTKPGQDSSDSDSDAAQRAFCAMLVRDHQGQPSLPGASLKGVLLARLRSMLGEPPAPLPAWGLCRVAARC